ncbi:hypothetical protein M0P65_00485 [Candidatus Gracilibacteria bacterium]|nr:hypothetical protein [Candidatus Gracilibacteria bacterium]
MMNKIKIFIALFLISFVYQSYAINVYTIGSQSNNCSEANVNTRIYVPAGQNSLDISVRDLFRTTGLSFILNANSSVNIWSNNNILAPNCSNPANWFRVSSVSPGNMLWVIAFANNTCTVDISSRPNRNNPVGQFVYNIGFKNETGFGVGNTSIGYFYYRPNGLSYWPQESIPNQTNRTWSNPIEHGNECFNLYVDYCGDGVITNGESCDPTDPTRTGWGANGCNASCQPINGGGGGGSSCGDGIKDAGEICDPADPTHTGWGTLGCNASCQPLNGGGGGGGGGFCGNGILEAGEQCDDGNNISGDGCSATCTTGGGGGGGGGVTTNPGINSYCGDGVVERPNASGQFEQCDTTESWCQSCQYTSTNPGVSSPGSITITNPGLSSPISLSSYKVIVGEGVNIFSKSDTIKFDGGGNNIYLGGLPVKMVNNSDAILTGNDIQYTLPGNSGVGTVFFKDHNVYDGSGRLIDIVYNRTNFPNSITLFNGSSLYGYGYKGKPISTIYSNTRTPVIPSLSPSNTFYVSIGYLEENLPIRVSKSAISNTSGGNAYIAKPAGYDLGFINNNDFITNLKKGNFTVTSVNDTANLIKLSSLTTNITNENIQNEINLSASGSKENIVSLSKKSFITSFSNNISSLSDFNSLDKLGDNENIRLSKQTITINGALNLSGRKTIIIENGDLIINKNIKYSDNNSSWAFIVKNGNIIVSKDVFQISGAYMTLNGQINSDGFKISKQLIVDGSLYGDSGDLVKNRTYIRASTGYSAITTGVIINYSTRIFKNPPPLLLNYINQFNLDRVAK